MFTQKCIIKKKFDKEFLSKLSDIGYDIADLDGDEFGCEYIIAMYPYSTIDFLWSNQGHDDVVNNGVIDCGTNEELFLAIAALRDDTDKNQWFIHDDSDWNNTPSIFWYKCEEDSIIEDLAYNLMFNDCKKATVQELIEHFNK